MITRTIKYTASDGTEHDSPQAAAEQDLVMALARLKGMPAWSLTELTIKALARNPEALRDALNAYFEDLEAHPDVDAYTYTGYDQALGRIKRIDDNRICAICDGGPGNNCACTCGMKKWDEPDPKADHREPPHPSGLTLTDYAKDLCATATVYDWLAQGWTHEGLVKNGMAVEVTGTVGKPLDPAHMEVTLSNHRSDSFGGGFVSWTQPPQGDPDDPSTWRVETHEGEVAPGVRGFEMEVPAGAQLPTYDEGDIESVAIYQDGEWQHFDVSKDGTFTTDLSGTFQLDGDPDDPSTWRADLPVDHPQYCRPFGTRED